MEPEITDKERAMAELLMKRADPGATVGEFVGLLRACRAEKEAQGDETAQRQVLYVRDGQLDVLSWPARNGIAAAEAAEQTLRVAVEDDCEIVGLFLGIESGPDEPVQPKGLAASATKHSRVITFNPAYVSARLYGVPY